MSTAETKVGGNFVISEDTKKLVAKLRSVPSGEMITYTSLTATIGRDVLDGARGQLRTARQKLQNCDDHIHFVAVPRQGLRRLPDEEVARGGVRHMRFVRRAAVRGQDRMQISQTAWESLPNDAKVARNAMLAVLGTVEYSLRAKVVKQIEAYVAQTNELPNLDETLAFFKK